MDKVGKWMEEWQTMALEPLILNTLQIHINTYEEG